jgi:membrane-bound ClpP family serine protease
MGGHLIPLLVLYALPFALVAFWPDWKSFGIVIALAAALLVLLFTALQTAPWDERGLGFIVTQALFLVVAMGMISGALAGAVRLADHEHRVALNLAAFFAGPVLWLLLVR